MAIGDNLVTGLAKIPIHSRSSIVLGALIIAIATAGWAVVESTGAGSAGGDRLVGLTRPGSRVDALLVLRLRQRTLDRYLRGLVDPRSPLYQHYGDAASFGTRFGLSTANLRALRQTLARSGLQVTRSYPQRTALRVTGSAAAISRAFGVTLHEFVTASGVLYHAPSSPPRITPPLTSWVTAVADLNTRPQAIPVDVPNRTPGGLLGPGALAPDDAAQAYDAVPLIKSGIDGAGQTIAIVSFDRFVDSDISAFDAHFNRSGPTPQHIDVQGGTQVGNGHDEVDLDVQVIRGLAPKAQILSYEAPENTSWADMLNAIFAGKASIVSNSWTICETYLAQSDPADRAAAEQALKVAAYKGVTMFTATGDAGAFDCQRSQFSQRSLTVGFPPDSPWNVAVGGTVLSVRQNGSYLQETGWQDPLTNGGGGGGINPIDARPAWQSGPGIPSGLTRRATPDVSAAAAINSPWAVYVDGHLSGVWGTSAATPFWAASMLLIQQYLEQQKKGPLCFAAPLLYRLASTRQPYPAFHDVTVGGNRYYSAAPGWDFATGLGSPDVWNLARDIAAYRQAHPLPQIDNACGAQAR
jgi:subtilase family serine protease